MRFFRFFAYYGQPPVDPEALAAAGKLAHLLPSLSGERVWAELRRLLCAPNPAAIFQLMADRGVLGPLLPGTAWIARLAALVRPDIGREEDVMPTDAIEQGPDHLLGAAVRGRSLGDSRDHR